LEGEILMTARRKREAKALRNQGKKLMAAQRHVDTVNANRVPDMQPWFKALGISDLATHDFGKKWASTEAGVDLIVPLGQLAESDGTLGEEVRYLNLAEPGAGGHGPHGRLQGITGSGKTVLVRSIIGSLAANYSPSRVSFILADGKGGYTFAPFEGLPHQTLLTTDFDADPVRAGLILDRVIGEEMRRRETLLTRHDVRSIGEYRALRLRDSDRVDMPAVPDVVVVIEDFTEAFLEAPTALAPLPQKLLAIGRSLGFHLIWSSQSSSNKILAATDLRNMCFHISLTTASGRDSRDFLGSSAARELPIGTGHAYIRTHRDGDKLDRLQTFYTRARVPVGGGQWVSAIEALCDAIPNGDAS